VPEEHLMKDFGKNLGILMIIVVVLFVVIMIIGYAIGPNTTVSPAMTVPPSKADALRVDPRQLASDPQAYVGSNVMLTGVANNVTHVNTPRTIWGVRRESYTWVYFLAQVPTRSSIFENVVVYVFPKQTSLIRSESYNLWGIARGTEKTTIIATGASETVPVVEVYEYRSIAP